MANKRLPMRNVKEVLRLRYGSHLSVRTIADSLKLARSTVEDYINRVEKAGISWPLPENLTDAKLESRLFVKPEQPVSSAYPLPDWEYIHNERRNYKKFNLTLYELWLEYKEKYPNGYEQSQFYVHYRRWLGKLDYCMRQDHKAGEKVFVDYCDGLSIVDPRTGEVIPTQLFVAVWGASNYTYAEASLTQQLPCWIGSHVRAFEYFGCVPYVVVPDNLKSGVHKVCFYEPELNPTYLELAQHYGTVILPARVRKARDKAKVEAGVLVAQRWILAVLRHRTFFSMAELNAAIHELLEKLNTRPMRKLKKSRREVFESLDRPNAQSLPEQLYEYAEWIKPRVNLDYHIEVRKHYYSVPSRLLREQLDVRLTANTVEIFHKGERVRTHVRSYVEYGHTTLKEDMPPSHQKYLEWSPSRIIKWASTAVGPSTAMLAKKIMASRAHPEQGYRSCLGIMHLAKKFPTERIEAAAERAIRYSTLSFRSMRAILEKGLDRQVEIKQDSQITMWQHENIRGAEYYH